MFQLCDDGKPVYEVSEPSTPVRSIPNATPKKSLSDSSHATPNGSPVRAYNLRKRDRAFANGYIHVENS